MRKATARWLLLVRANLIGVLIALAVYGSPAQALGAKQLPAIGGDYEHSRLLAPAADLAASGNTGRMPPNRHRTGEESAPLAFLPINNTAPEFGQYRLNVTENLLDEETPAGTKIGTQLLATDR